MQQSEAFGDYRKRRVVVEHRLARLVQLGIRQARYFGRAKTKFQLYLAATVANLTLVAGKTGLSGSTGGGAEGHRAVLNAVRAVAANAAASFSAVRPGLPWSRFCSPQFYCRNPSPQPGLSVRVSSLSQVENQSDPKGCLERALLAAGEPSGKRNRAKFVRDIPRMRSLVSFGGIADWRPS